jgi:hypothetical protein
MNNLYISRVKQTYIFHACLLYAWEFVIVIMSNEFFYHCYEQKFFF